MDETESGQPPPPPHPNAQKTQPSLVSVSAAVERAMKAADEWRANKGKKGKTNSLDRVDVLFGGFFSLMCGAKGHTHPHTPARTRTHPHALARTSQVTVDKEPLELFFCCRPTRNMLDT